MKLNYKNVNLYLDNVLVKIGKRIAFDNGTSLSKIVNSLLEDYINEYISDVKKE